MSINIVVTYSCIAYRKCFVCQLDVHCCSLVYGLHRECAVQNGLQAMVSQVHRQLVSGWYTASRVAFVALLSLRANRALWTNRTSRTLFAFSAVSSSSARNALWAFLSLGALWTNRTNRTLWPWGACWPLFAVSAISARNSLWTSRSGVAFLALWPWQRLWQRNLSTCDHATHNIPYVVD